MPLSRNHTREISFAKQLLASMFRHGQPRPHEAVMFQLAFDESGTHDKVLLTVAGYVASTEQWGKLASEWLGALPKEQKPFHAKPFFHWVNKHRDGPAARDLLWGALARRVNRGFQVSISVADYERVVPPKLRSTYGSAYTMCVQECLRQIEKWADGQGYDEPFAYFFESGHQNQGQVSDMLMKLKANPKFSRAFRLGSYAFADKSFVPLQAADMLAHQVNRFVRSARRCKIVPVYERNFRKTLPDQIKLKDEAWIRDTLSTMEEVEREIRVRNKPRK